MYSFEVLLTVAIAMIIIGVLIGMFVAQRTAPSRQNQRQLEEHMNELQQQQQDYQHEVTEHFEETAKLLNQLTSNYKDVHSHLARGALLLAGEKAETSITALVDDSQAEAPVEQPTDIESMAPPLDYAPKTDDEPGMLNEEFGLEKASIDNEDLEIAANK